MPLKTIEWVKPKKIMEFGKEVLDIQTWVKEQQKQNEKLMHQLLSEIILTAEEVEVSGSKDAIKRQEELLNRIAEGAARHIQSFIPEIGAREKPYTPYSILKMHEDPEKYADYIAYKIYKSTDEIEGFPEDIREKLHDLTKEKHAALPMAAYFPLASKIEKEMERKRNRTMEQMSQGLYPNPTKQELGVRISNPKHKRAIDKPLEIKYDALPIFQNMTDRLLNAIKKTDSSFSDDSPQYTAMKEAAIKLANAAKQVDNLEEKSVKDDERLMKALKEAQAAAKAYYDAKGAQERNKRRQRRYEIARDIMKIPSLLDDSDMRAYANLMKHAYPDKAKKADKGKAM